MIDLGPLGVLEVAGSFYLPVLLIALLVCALNRPFWAIGIITLIGWAGTRLIDLGGAVGDIIVATSDSEQMIVATIAVCLAALDFSLAILVLYYSRHLKLSRLIAAIYGCMIPFYGLAIVGIMSGSHALFWVSVLGLCKLSLIIAAGGAAMAARRDSRYDRRSLSARFLDLVAPWVVAQTDLARNPVRHRLS